MTTQLPTINPQHAVLLVMDYQPAILGSLGERIFPRQAHVITIAQLAGLLSAPEAAGS
jgi:hypothetical protein